MKSEMSSKKSEELIVKENDFLGFKKLRLTKQLRIMKKHFEVTKAQFLKIKLN